MLNKRLLLLVLIIPFLISGTAVAGEATITAKPKIEAKQLDKRAEMLQAYLAKFNSPMQYQAQNFVDAADKNDLDWRLVASIAGVESTFGKHIPGGNEQSSTSYNAWGWGVYGTQAIYFDSWKDGIDTVSEGLRKNYLNKGLNDPYEINRVYAASPTWGAHVSYFLADLDKFQKGYKNFDVSLVKFYPDTAGTSATLAPKYI